MDASDIDRRRPARDGRPGRSRAVALRGVALLLMLAGCDRSADSGVVVVSAIGGSPSAGMRATDAPSRLLLDATAEGLVRFDAAGQIESGLAERWTVIDDGTSYIFRLREGRWSDGAPITAEQVVAILGRRVRPSSGNPLTPFLTAIDEIVVMTPQVIEVRLKRPRPDLLKLFAQPEMALLRARPPAGAGPFRIARGGPTRLLRPAVDPDRADPDAPGKPAPEEDVRLIGERAARAVARFAGRRSDLVTGGTFADWPLIAAATIAPGDVRVDPAAGLFGFAIAGRQGFFADPANRAAIVQSIDRVQATAAIAPAWEPTDRLLPDGLDSAAAAAVPAWAQLSLAERRAGARARVARWPTRVVVRIALPTGPGATLLYAQVAAGLLAIGAVPERTAIDAPAELRLIDRVAPYDSARWYLANACAPCGPAAEAALVAARDAPTLAERSRLIAVADAALADDVAFIPIARPLRWSLVAPRLRQWQPNSRAWHPLNRLRADTN